MSGLRTMKDTFGKKVVNKSLMGRGVNSVVSCLP